MVVATAGCAGLPPTTLNHAPRALTTECTVTVTDDTAVFDLGLRPMTDDHMLLLGDGDHLAARRGDGPLSLLTPSFASDTSDAYAPKKYEMSIVGNGDPRIAWSRGDAPYAWVTIPTPPALGLRFERAPRESLSWTSTSDGRPETEAELWVTCESSAQIGACPAPFGSSGPTPCGVRRALPRGASSISLAELVDAAPNEADASRCGALIVLATQTRRVDVSAAGLAPASTCASRRTESLKITRGPR